MFHISTVNQYNYCRKQGRRNRIWSLLTGRSRRLLSVSEIEATSKVQARQCRRIQTVAIDRICGSEGRCQDFDLDFYPLRDHNRSRWLSVASARERGMTLPPVELIQV